jgi:glycosyltransferase involved in cell wall biosynthesis
MRVLWFTNTPSLATEPLTGKPTVGGGWIESLEKKMLEAPDIDCAVVFPWKTDTLQTFHFNDSTYYGYPVYRAGGKWKKTRDRIAGRIEPDDEVAYFLQIVEEFQPDIIHVFGSERSYGLLIPQVKVPVLLWIQGNLTVYARKWFAGISAEEVRKYERPFDRLKGHSWAHKYKRALNVAAREQEIFRHTRYFTGRTDWDRRLAMTLSPGSQYFHCDEVMRDPFYEQAWQPHEGREAYRLFTTIRGNIYKGLGTIFEAAKLLKPILDRPLEWHLAGMGPKHDLALIFERQTGIAPADYGVRLLGNRTPEELVAELLDTDIFVHPSHIDNSPNSVCEAMLMGVPVVSTNVGGIPSLITNNEDGLLVQDGDPYALAGAIADLLLNPDVAYACSQAARERGLLRNDPDKIFNDLMDIYDQVLTSAPAPTTEAR